MSLKIHVKWEVIPDMTVTEPVLPRVKYFAEHDGSNRIEIWNDAHQKYMPTVDPKVLSNKFPEPSMARFYKPHLNEEQKTADTKNDFSPSQKV